MLKVMFTIIILGYFILIIYALTLCLVIYTITTGRPIHMRNNGDSRIRGIFSDRIPYVETI